jgi:hypothetical protein
MRPSRLARRLGASALFSGLFGLVTLASACAKKTESVRDALARDDVSAVKSIASVPECGATETGREHAKGCLDALAKALGSREAFNVSNPDQAAAAAVAVLLVRERRGDWVLGDDTWIMAMKSAKGAGADALRLAVATRMCELAPRLGKKIDDDKEAASLVHDLGTAFPGACATYAAMPLDAAALSAMPPAEHPDHAPCVQKDLARAGSLGVAYGYGVWRALEATTALWNDELRALHAGAALMTGAPRESLDRKLATIDEATARIALKRVTVPGNAWAQGGGATMHIENAAVPSASASASATSSGARPR